VTPNCNDGTSLTVNVNADGLAQLTAAVRGMIDHPVGLGCALIQNPLARTVSFEHPFAPLRLTSSSAEPLHLVADTIEHEPSGMPAREFDDRNRRP
jgi:hypothetical protein